MKLRFKKVSGSITIYLALSMIIILALVCTLIESAHQTAMSARFQSLTYLSEDALFSRYIKPLFDEYGIMLLQGDEVFIEKTMSSHVGSSMSVKRLIGGDRFLLDGKLESISLTSVNSPDIDGGRAVLNQITQYMKGFLSDSEINGYINDANRNYQELGKEAVDEIESTDRGILAGSDYGDEIEDPYEKSVTLIGDGIISTVAKNVSEARINTGLSPSMNLKSRNQTLNVTLSERVLLSEYALNKFSNYTAKQRSGLSGSVIKYETEYLLYGARSDKENLAAVCQELLALREGMNVIGIVSDPAKMAQVSSLAISMTLANPAAAAAVEALLIGSWALAESMVDVAALLNGGKIAITKLPSDWAVSIGNIFNYSHLISGAGSIKNTGGLSYKGYLRLLLNLRKPETTLIRALDLMELNIEQAEGMGFSIIDCVDEIEVNAKYRGKLIFMSLGFTKGMTKGKSGLTHSITQRYKY